VLRAAGARIHAAAGGVAAGKEAQTRVPLLGAPSGDMEIVAGKLLGVLVPGGVLSVVSLLTYHLAASQRFGAARIAQVLDPVTMAELFGLSKSEAAMLNEVPMRGEGTPMPPTDPLIYRFYELVMVNGPAWKALIEEEYGDGIMSAIDFDMTIDREANPKGDRVKLGMTGKFLPFKYYGAKGNEQAYGFKEE